MTITTMSIKLVYRSLLMAGAFLFAACAASQPTIEVTRVVTVEVTASPAATPTPEGGVLIISADEQRQRWSARIPAVYETLQPPFALDATAATAGRTIYTQNNCAICHGPKGDGQGFLSKGLNPRPINFTDAALMQRLSDAYLFWRLSEGGAEPPFVSAMPAWKDILSAEERWQLVAYLRSLSTSQEAGAGEEQLGLTLLQQYGCLGCHRYAGKGNFAGPDLDGLGARSDAETIRRAILDPSAELTKGFRDIMPKDYGDKISPEDLEIIVQFLAQSTG